METVSVLVPEKDQVRKRVWETFQAEGVARFPGAWGRIPNFAGAGEAARRLTETDFWREARVIKCNPDSPQLPLRRAALKQGKLVYMAVPRLRDELCFIRLDPAELGAPASSAATIAGAFRHGRPVAPEDVPPVDIVVCGSVAVSMDGSRVGKGGGYSDLEFAILSELGKISQETVVATTVHELQVLAEPLPVTPHDLPVDYIATPERLIACAGILPRPAGIFWDVLSAEKIEPIPVLRRFLSELTAVRR